MIGLPKRQHRLILLLLSLCFLLGSVVACDDGPPDEPEFPTRASTDPPPPQPDPTTDRPSVGELLAHLGWSPGGGGGPFEHDECGTGGPDIWVNTSGYYRVNEVGIHYAEAADASEGVLGMLFRVVGCDYPAGETVRITYFLPDGTSFQARDEVAVESYGPVPEYWRSLWWSVPGEPLGTYYVDVEGGGQLLTATFSVSTPPEPYMLISCGEVLPRGTAVLTGFQPGEEVLMAAYVGTTGEDQVLLDNWYVSMDAEGNAMTTLPDKPVDDEWLVVGLGRDRPMGTEAMPVSVASYYGYGC